MKNVILDTDLFNECDDQFALAYLLKSKENFNIEAVTLSPFYNSRMKENDGGIEKSFQEAKTIFKLCNTNSHNKIFRGSKDYISNGYNSKNDAVNKIIEVA